MSLTETNKISIIVPAYNYGRYLEECLDSVLRQSHANWECIIVDNGSTDTTRDVATAFTRRDPRFIYHYTEQKGVSFARNLAVTLSTGAYIFPLDADDKIAPTYLEKAVAILAPQAAIKVVYCEAELFGAVSRHWVLPAYSFKNLLIENSIFSSAMYRKADFEAAGGYNENMKEGFEDWDFWIRLLKSGGEVYKISEILFYYRIRPGSRNNSLDRGKQLRLRRQIVENHKEAYEKHFELHELIFDYYTAAKELEAVKRSGSLKLGQGLLRPLQLIKGLFNRRQA